MKNDRVFDDKRLLGTLDGVETRFLSEALEYYDDPIPTKTKRARAAMYKRIALLAACIVLCAAAFPVVNYVLPRLGVVFGGNAGTGSEDSIDLSEFADMSERDLIEHIGKVPKEFQNIIENNLFKRSYSTGDHVFVTLYGSDGVDYIVYDKYGNVVDEIDLKNDSADTYRVYRLSDGNYIKVRAYDHHNMIYMPDGEQVSWDTKASVEKFTPDGKTVFETEFDIRSDLEYFYEFDDGYIIAGWSQKWSDTETEYFYIYRLDQSGNIVHQRKMAEDICKMECVDGELIVYTRQMRKYANGSRYAYYKHYLNDTLSTRVNVETLEPDADIISYNNFNSYAYWRIQNFIPNFDAGSVSSVIYYDDFLLIISERNTKGFTSVPTVYSSNPSYTETVYTAYTYDAEIIWRSAVDSTDYERLAEIKKEYEEERERFKKWKTENE